MLHHTSMREYNEWPQKQGREGVTRNHGLPRRPTRANQCTRITSITTKYVSRKVKRDEIQNTDGRVNMKKKKKLQKNGRLLV